MQRGRPPKENPNTSTVTSSGRSFRNQINIDFGNVSPKQAKMFKSKKRYIAYGGARGGGKTWAVIRLSALRCIEHPGIRVLIVRRKFDDLDETIIQPTLKLIPERIRKYDNQKHTLTFTNGSYIKYDHLHGIADTQDYQGKEYELVFIDEATQFTEAEFRMLCSCQRSPTKEFPMQTYLTCNPGGIGHQWVKRLFIDRKYNGPDGDRPAERPGDYEFIQALVEDNKAVMEGSPDYVYTLDMQPENVRKAWRYGDWDSLGGQFFSEFSDREHVVKHLAPPKDWIRYRAIDYGYDMFACLWVAVDESGTAYVYREYQRSNLNVSQAAEKMHELTAPGERIACTIIPPDLWKRSSDTGRTPAEILASHDIAIVKANNSREHGWLAVREYLNPPHKPGETVKPKLYISSECRELIENLHALQTDEKDPKDAATQPHEITHNCDALRYFCITRTVGTAEKEEETPPEYHRGHRVECYEEFLTGGEPEDDYLAFG